MLKQRALILLALCSAVPAQAGLFSDDEARDKIKQLEGRVLTLEEAGKQQTKSMMDLQGQIESLNDEIRKLRGRNEELAHGLQDAEKREKDFYVDLDTRLRHFESAEASQKAASSPAPVSTDPDDPAAEDRDYEAAYGLYKGGSYAPAAKAFREFMQKYPESVNLPNATYWLGNTQFALKDYEGALETYRNLRKNYPATPKDADVLFNIAGCQQELKQVETAHKTLRFLISKYPASEAAAKAKKLLAATK